MSNIDFSSSDEQLFNELTPEQSSVIEGGSFLLLHDISAIRTGADGFSGDDVYINVNGQRKWGEVGMSAGGFAVINTGLDVGATGTISLFDGDWPDDDDYLGGFTVNGPTNGRQVIRVSGSGSIYDVAYSVF